MPPPATAGAGVRLFFSVAIGELFDDVGGAVVVEDGVGLARVQGDAAGGTVSGGELV